MDPALRTAALQRAAAALASDPASAEREARALLAALPGDPNATLVLGSALRRQGRAGEAVEALEALVRAFPKAPPGRYELGMALADAGRRSDAIMELEAVTALDGEHAEAWRALGTLRFEAGDARGAERAFNQHRRASVRDPRLRPMAAVLFEGRATEAEARLRTFLAGAPNAFEAIELLAEALARQGRHPEAAFQLERVVDASPANDAARFRLANALLQQQKPAAAQPHVERLIAAEPDNPAYRNLLAGAQTQLGDFEGALATYEALVADHPAHAPTWVRYGHALRMFGRSTDAVGAYRRAIELDPRLAEAYLGLADLKTRAFTDEEAAALAALAQRPGSTPAERQQANFALGAALEDRGDFAAAFAAYAQGAASRRAERGYDPNLFTEEVARSRAMLGSAFFAGRASYGSQASDPILIVGLPRSGSTLVEQILATHSEVEGVAELPDIGFIADGFQPYPDALTRLDPEQAQLIGDGYIATTRIQRRLERPFFIDKMPNNFRLVALIQLILPRAKIIDVRRHPMATCFSAFKQHFAQGQAFSYDLADLGRFYRDYVDLMAHFDAVLPGRVHRVIYEDLVEDPEAEIRRLLDYCELPFEPACLSFHETERPVRTASSEQVRRPITREALDQWRNFEPWLGPLKAALGPALESWR